MRINWGPCVSATIDQQYQDHRTAVLTLSKSLETYLSRLMTKPTKWHVRLVKTQISLGVRPVYQSLLSAWRKLGSFTTHWTHSETPIRLGRCQGWSESWLGAVILLLLSCGSSNNKIVSLFHYFQVAELNRLDQQYKDQINFAITQSERLVSGKIGKQTYIETEKGVNDKREEIYRKMEELCASLN